MQKAAVFSMKALINPQYVTFPGPDKLAGEHIGASAVALKNPYFGLFVDRNTTLNEC